VRANAQAGLRTRRDVNQLALNDPTLVSYQRAVAEMVRLDTDEPGKSTFLDEPGSNSSKPLPAW